jgi:D-sedoheptulose 7-phosphate isomerase
MSEILRHISDHQRTIEALHAQVPAIEQLVDRVIRCLEDGGCVFWLGNGGSAADCQHLAAELVGRFERERRGYASIALTTDSSILTSVSNDYGFERVFVRQIEALCRPRDLVIGISTSGNSANVLNALEAARSQGASTVGLGGRDGGRLKEVTDLCVIVPVDNTARIQEAHILIGHILCDLVESRFAEAD